MEAVPHEWIIWNLALFQGHLLAIETVYPLIWHIVFDVKTQLSLHSDELWLVFDDLYVSEDIVHEAGQCNIGFSPHHSNTSYNRAVHCSFDETEDMLYPASGFGYFPVVLLLLVSKRMATVSLLADDRIHATRLDHIFFGFIACIKIQVLVFVWLFKDFCNDVRIVDFSRCALVLLYKFGLLVALTWPL